MKGRKADRVPLDLSGFHFPLRERIDAVDDPARRQIALRIFDQTHYVVPCGSGINRYLVTPPQFMREVKRDQIAGRLTCTTEIDTPKGKLTAVTAHSSSCSSTYCKAPGETCTAHSAVSSMVAVRQSPAARKSLR